MSSTGQAYQVRNDNLLVFLVDLVYLFILVRHLTEKEVFMPNGQEPKEIKVNFPPELQGGVYSNNMVVTHSREEFILDFLMVAPPAGTVTARVIVSPGHMKRILRALDDNISKYEKAFGTIQVAEEPKGKILS